MDLTEFKKQATVEELCTTNGWGFGGYSGKGYRYGKYYIRLAKYHYRHIKSTPYNGYYYDGKPIEKKDFIKKIGNLKGKK